MLEKQNETASFVMVIRKHKNNNHAEANNNKPYTNDRMINTTIYTHTPKKTKKHGKAPEDNLDKIPHDKNKNKTRIQITVKKH